MSTYDTNIPNSPEYLQAAAMANQAYQMAMAQIAAQRSSTLRGAGYLDSSKDNALVLDPNNLYGTVQTMFRNAAIQDRGVSNDYAGRGIQGGLRNQAISGLQQLHGGEASQFGTGLDNQLGQYTMAGQQAAMTRDSALWQAQQAALNAAMMQQLFNQGMVQPVDAGTAGAVAPIGTNPYYPDPSVPPPDTSIPWWLLK